MTKLELRMIYKADTGCSAIEAEEIELDVFRSKGQWILNMTDEEVMNLRNGLTFMRPDTDYVSWLEEKLMEFLTK